ncbi:MAG: SOS response-associated peptidase, partial [Fibrobacteres bacterium]|nr:SOS response-associated peptidase [Fibrobacterota bacterium]
QTLPVVTNVLPDCLSFFKWGLIPSWAKYKNIGAKMINARAETLTEKPAFRESLRSKRCLVPASGFYEWKHYGKQKQACYITLTNEPLFTFAGLWDTWIDRQTGESISSFTIITTEANKLMQTVHDRMPVILRKEQERDWLNGNLRRKYLVPYAETDMKLIPVSDRVNSPANNDSDLIKYELIQLELL